MFGNFYHLEHFSLVIWGFLTHVIDSLSFENSFFYQHNVQDFTNIHD